jgi:hypothetical protein
MTDETDGDGERLGGKAQILSDSGEISKVAQLHGGFYW